MIEPLALREVVVGRHFQGSYCLAEVYPDDHGCFGLTSSFPADERFGLTNQLRRASVSVASNLAEGYGRATTGEYVQFLGHARGSNCEVQTQLVIAAGLGFGSEEERSKAEQLSLDVGRMLAAMMSKLQS